MNKYSFEQFKQNILIVNAQLEPTCIDIEVRELHSLFLWTANYGKFMTKKMLSPCQELCVTTKG